MGASQPYLCSPAKRDSRFPTTTFDPKAVTRASWEPKPRKPQPRGPLVSFNQHPDSHFINPHQPFQGPLLGLRTKRWIQTIRRLQLALRIVQLNGAAGILALMILTVNVELIAAWILRIASGVSMIHCVYAIYHLSGNAASRTPGSSAAYQVFAIMVDLGIMGINTFGAFTTHRQGSTWGTRLSDQGLMRHFVPAVYYTLIGTAASHLITLTASLWLGIVFRKISLMPPDMNPLEDHLTARPFSHKRNKSSITTASSIDCEKRHSTPRRGSDDSDQPRYEPFRPSLVPFLHTRANSSHSGASWPLPSGAVNGQYHSVPGSSSRDSHSLANSLTHVATYKSANSRSYLKLPIDDIDNPVHEDMSSDAKRPRTARFTETWQPTDSLISRTKHRAGSTMPGVDVSHDTGDQHNFLLAQNYDVVYGFEPEADLDSEPNTYSLTSKMHPNPLRSNPASCSEGNQEMGEQEPFDARTEIKNPKRGPLSESSGNKRQPSLSKDIADELLQHAGTWKRKSSIQPEDDFFSPPLRDSACVPRPLSIASSRKVSSGNDYGVNGYSLAYGRRIISGRQVEEGRVGARAW
ncbi:hypothetical protein HIM_02755 [Hirsutella minnesotensis 3608]|nr:hypothetical protein HIM_02755 [Hirsutella minnesotensis 3608]